MAFRLAPSQRIPPWCEHVPRPVLCDTDPSLQTVTTEGGAVSHGNVIEGVGWGTCRCSTGSGVSSQWMNIHTGKARKVSTYTRQAVLPDELFRDEREGMRAL